MKVPRAVSSDKPIANGKGVHCEVESERSPRQTFDPTNRNFVRHMQVDKAAKQAEVLKLLGTCGVNEADTRRERLSPYPGRALRHDPTTLGHGVKLTESSQPKP